MKVKTLFFTVVLGASFFLLAFQIKCQGNPRKLERQISSFNPALSVNQPKLTKTERTVLNHSVNYFQSKTEDESAFMDKMKIRMQKRRESIKTACTKLGLRERKSKEIELIMSKKYKLVYCPIPKTGCSNLKRVMLALNGFANKSEDVFPMRVMGQTNLLHQEISVNFSTKSVGMPEVVREQNFKKLIVVRHPFERAVSAYNNKLVNEKSGEAQFHRRAQLMRKKYGSSERKQDEGDSPTFEEFISYMHDVNNTERNGEDNHWNSYDVICQPCQNDYDVIAKLETINEDLRYLMKLIGAPPQLTMPVGYSKSGKSTTSREIVIKFFNSLPRKKIDDLFEVYKVDFLSFGYTIGDFLQSPG